MSLSSCLPVSKAEFRKFHTLHAELPGLKTASDSQSVRITVPSCSGQGAWALNSICSNWFDAQNGFPSGFQETLRRRLQSPRGVSGSFWFSKTVRKVRRTSQGGLLTPVSLKTNQTREVSPCRDKIQCPLNVYQMAMGQTPVPPVNIPIPTKTGTPNWVANFHPSQPKWDPIPKRALTTAKPNGVRSLWPTFCPATAIGPGGRAEYPEQPTTGPGLQFCHSVVPCLRRRRRRKLGLGAFCSPAKSCSLFWGGVVENPT